jgi:hypothetical protein
VLDTDTDRACLELRLIGPTVKNHASLIERPASPVRSQLCFLIPLGRQLADTLLCTGDRSRYRSFALPIFVWDLNDVRSRSIAIDCRHVSFTRSGQLLMRSFGIASGRMSISRQGHASAIIASTRRTRAGSR